MESQPANHSPKTSHQIRFLIPLFATQYFFGVKLLNHLSETSFK